MRALVWHGPRSITLEKVPKPVPAPGEVVVRVEAVGICGSELSGYLGHNSLRKPPLIMGHEFCGQVVEPAGEGPLRPGERAVVNPLISCGQCTMCRDGLDNLCLHRALLGAHRPGAFAEWVAVPERNCTPLPPNLGPVAGALVEPLACGLRAVELARIGPADSVLILGAGAIGLCTLAVARQAGAMLLMAADINPGRLSTALDWGATAALGPGTDVVAEVRRLTGELGADVVIDAVGATITRQTAVRAVRPGGRAVLVGLHEAESLLPANDVVRNEVQMSGCFAYRTSTFARAVALVRHGLLNLAGAWLEERPLTAGPASFAELVAGTAAATKIVLRV